MNFFQKSYRVGRDSCITSIEPCTTTSRPFPQMHLQPCFFHAKKRLTRELPVLVTDSYYTSLAWCLEKHFRFRHLNFILKASVSWIISGYINNQEKFFRYWQGSVPLITIEAAHQLHILIFILAVFHVLYSAATMMLGKLKVISTYSYTRFFGCIMICPLLCID